MTRQLAAKLGLLEEAEMQDVHIKFFGGRASNRNFHPFGRKAKCTLPVSSSATSAERAGGNLYHYNCKQMRNFMARFELPRALIEPLVADTFPTQRWLEKTGWQPDLCACATSALHLTV